MDSEQGAAEHDENGEVIASTSGSRGRRSKGSFPAHVSAAKAIGTTFIALGRVDETLKDTRKRWKGTLDAANASFKQSVEESVDYANAGAVVVKLKNIVTTHQFIEEQEAGRKAELHLLIEERKELKAKLQQQVTGAEQLGLFDGI